MKLSRVVTVQPVNHDRWCCRLGCGHSIKMLVKPEIGTLLQCNQHEPIRHQANQNPFRAH